MRSDASHIASSLGWGFSAASATQAEASIPSASAASGPRSGPRASAASATAATLHASRLLIPVRASRMQTRLPSGAPPCRRGRLAFVDGPTV